MISLRWTVLLANDLMISWFHYKYVVLPYILLSKCYAQVRLILGDIFFFMIRSNPKLLIRILNTEYFQFWSTLFAQPCGHYGVCKKCADEILFCPTCSEIIDSFRDPKLIAPLRPLSFGDAFNSVI